MARPRQVTDEQILQSMRSCALEQGVNVSLDVVAARLGVTAPALLKRFGNRQALLLRALRPPLAPTFLEHFKEGPDGRPFPLQLRERLGDMGAFFAEVVPGLVMLKESGATPAQIFEGQRPDPAIVVRAIAGWLRQAEAAGLARVPAPDVVASCLMGAVQLEIMTAHLSGRHVADRAMQRYLDDLSSFFSNALAATKVRRARRPPPSPRKHRGTP